MGQPRKSSLHQRVSTPRVSWANLIGAALALSLVVALVAAVLVQARQFATLRQTLQARDDQAVQIVHQVQLRTLRLRESLQRAADDRQRWDGDAVRSQFAQWRAGADDLQADAVRALLGDDATFIQMRAEFAHFATMTDAALGSRPVLALNRDFVAALLPALDALDAPLQTLAAAAASQAARRIEQRARAVQRQNQIGLALTVFMALLTAAFAAVVLRHLSQLSHKRQALEQRARSLDQARAEAEIANESKSVFLANMSHEVRTPFHGLMGMLSILRETGLSPRQLDYLRTATESADHLLAILNDILDMSQLETGRMAINPSATELRGLLRDVEALIRPQANAKALTLHVESDPGLPECILADPTRIKQILLNLLSNAVKFSDRGTVVLDVRTGSDGHGPTHLIFVVTDTGIGIDEATRRQLFQRFMRGDSSQSRRHTGTGLGLEISRNLARLMHGEITASSRPGEGSVFTFSLPLQVVPACASDDPGSGDVRGLGLATQRLRVLVAEDHPVNRQYMAALLDNLGHHAHFTANGEEAVQAAQLHGFDLVLMDLHMPVLDGLAATRAIRALPNREAATVPIVALTADALEQTRDSCLVAGMNDFLTKPVSPQKLASALRRLFGSAVCGNGNGNGIGSGSSGSRSGSSETPAVAQHLAARAEGHPVIDEAALQLAMQAMARARLAGLIDAFLTQGPQTVQRLRAAVRDAQPLELRVNAHAAKGAALNLGLSALAATAQALHEGAAHLPAHEIARLVQRFEDLLPLTREAIRGAGLHVAADAPVAPDALKE